MNTKVMQSEYTIYNTFTTDTEFQKFIQGLSKPKAGRLS